MSNGFISDVSVTISKYISRIVFGISPLLIMFTGCIFWIARRIDDGTMAALMRRDNKIVLGLLSLVFFEFFGRYYAIRIAKNSRSIAVGHLSIQILGIVFSAMFMIVP